jgi:aromatic-L-amino-acid decarboxylase
MSPTEFRQFGHEVVDRIADYLAHPERYPVLPPCRPGDLTDELPASGPERASHGGDPKISRSNRPAQPQWNHRLHGVFFDYGVGPGILGEMLAAASNQRHGVEDIAGRGGAEQARSIGCASG